MRRLVAIIFAVLGLLVFKQLDFPTAQTDIKCEIIDLHNEQLVSNHNYNNDAESPSSVVVPSAQIRTVNGQRTNTYRAPHIATAGHFYTISNYVVAQYLYRLGSLPRAIDYYLYTLCRLRL